MHSKNIYYKNAEQKQARTYNAHSLKNELNSLEKLAITQFVLCALQLLSAIFAILSPIIYLFTKDAISFVTFDDIFGTGVFLLIGFTIALCAVSFIWLIIMLTMAAKVNAYKNHSQRINNSIMWLLLSLILNFVAYIFFYKNLNKEIVAIEEKARAVALEQIGFSLPKNINNASKKAV